MPNGNLHIVASERSCKRSSCVPVHQHQVGLNIGKKLFHQLEDRDRDIKKGLPLFHDRESIIGYDMKCVQHLMQLV